MLSFATALRLILAAYVRQRPVRTLLTILGVSIGVAASVAVRTANTDVLRTFERAVLTVAGPTTLEVVGGELGFDETLIAPVRRIPGVRSANPVIVRTAAKDSHASHGESIQLLGLDVMAEFDSRGFQVPDSENVETRLQDLLRPDSLFLGRQLAASWQLSQGDFVDLVLDSRRITCRVAGILESRSGRASSWDRLAVMDIAAAQVAFNMVGRVDRIDLVTADDRSVEVMADALRAVLPSYVTVERPVARTAQVEQMVRAFRLNLSVLSWVGVLVGVFLIYNTMAFAVAQRRRDVGIFRAIGMTQSRVCGLFVAEAAVWGLVGGLVGSLAGIGLAQELISVIGRTISDLYVPVVVEAEPVWWRAAHVWMMLEGIAIGCLVSMVGSIGPSLDAGRTAAVRALAPGDYEISRQLRVGLLGFVGASLIVSAGLLSLGGPIGGMPLLGYGATFCLLAGLSCLAPICLVGGSQCWRRNRAASPPGSWRMMRHIAIEHAAGNPGRNGVTVSALMVGLAIMIGVVVMVRSFRHTVELWINDTVIADVVVAPSAWLRGNETGGGARSLPPSWHSILSSLPEVAAVDIYRDVRVTVGGQRVALVSRDLRLHAERSRYLVRQGESSAQLHRAADTGGILLSEVLANRLGISEGQSLEINTPEGARTFPIVAVFFDYATDGGKLVMDRALYRLLWHDEQVTVFPVYLAAGADVVDVRRKIERMLKDVNGGGLQPLLIGNSELRKDILDIFDRTFLLTYVLEAIAMIIAMLGIINTLVTSVMERRREFATLRAVGGSEGQIQQLVLWEAAYLGVIGTALGLVGGGLLSVLLIKVINKQSFGWTIQMTLPMGALVQAIGLAAAVTLIAGYFPARWAAQQPVAEGLRGE